MWFPYVSVVVVVVVVVVVKSGAERKQTGGGRKEKEKQLRRKSNNLNLKCGEKTCVSNLGIELPKEPPHRDKIP